MSHSRNRRRDDEDDDDDNDNRSSKRSRGIPGWVWIIVAVGGAALVFTVIRKVMEAQKKSAAETVRTPTEAGVVCSDTENDKFMVGIDGQCYRKCNAHSTLVIGPVDVAGIPSYVCQAMVPDGAGKPDDPKKLWIPRLMVPNTNCDKLPYDSVEQKQCLTNAGCDAADALYGSNCVKPCGANTHPDADSWLRCIKTRTIMTGQKPIRILAK